MDESLIRAGVLFFLVTIEDEKVYPAAELALTSARRRKFSNPSESLYALLISECSRIYKSKRFQSLSGTRPLDIDFLPPSKTLSEVRSLKDKVSEKLYLSFVWNEVIKAPLSDIARGLGETEGSVEHRSFQVLKRWVSGE